MSAIISFIKRSLLPPLFFLLLLLFLVVYSQSPLNHNNFTNSFSYLISSYDKLKTTFVTTTTTEDHNNNVKNESLLGAPARSPAPLPPPAPLPEPRHADVAVKVRHQKKKKRRVEKIEDDLAKARAAIRKAIRTRNYTAEKEQIYIPRGSVYRNPFAFHQSHIEMEKRFKVWLYKEGEWPLVHSGPVNDIYGIEGQFIQEMESGTSHFMARNPNEAHAFFLPISVAYIIKIIYRPLVTYSRDQLQRLVLDYIRVVADKYPYWNRSSGADHFLVSCHDWAPDISGVNPDFFKNFIRALCNANTSEGFRPHRDVSIPEINIPRGTLGPPDRLIRASTKRPILAFFAGGAHGNIRKILLQHWKDKDKDVQVHEYLPSQKSYFKTMGQTRFCLCPSGYEVASPRVVTSLHAGCVPVIISDYYELPFNDVLDWSKFSIHIPSEKIPDIKKILEGIPHDKYVKMQRRVKKVSKHFELNRPAQPFDVIHMLLHSIWLRRLNFMLDTP